MIILIICIENKHDNLNSKLKKENHYHLKS
jgi:hypothetical protein